MIHSLATQPSLTGFCPVAEAVEKLAAKGGIEERGAIYTRREVVDFILDLSGYTTDAPLTSFRLLEPSCGGGDFLLPVLERLLSVAAAEEGGLSVQRLLPAVRAVELHRDTFQSTYRQVSRLLVSWGFLPSQAEELTSTWLMQGDFLLGEFGQDFTHVVGNPPYVRQESIPDVLMSEYRRRYQTVFDRADIYVPFIEQSLRLLAPEGKLAFICADRWMKNKYGRKLRGFVSNGYSLSAYVDMVGTNAFHREVSAYPAITVIERADRPRTCVFAKPEIDGTFLSSLAKGMTDDTTDFPGLRSIDRVALNDDAWVLGSFDELALVRRLEGDYPLIEDAGCKIGIGVATGADKAFIGDYEALDVEPSRKLPLVMTRDIPQGHVAWRGKGIINPFGDDGKLVSLDEFPKLRAYLEARREQIARRHIAAKNPQNWYRTIDRIYPELAEREKLLIPDIKGDASIVYEDGRLYPHHNLYYITSDEWDVHALQAVMRSGIARLFVGLYCTRMRGGYLRFQAQYLRKIRLPKWENVSTDLRQRLAEYAGTDDQHGLNGIVSELYGLTRAEWEVIDQKGKN